MDSPDSGLRGNKGAPSTPTAGTRDPQSPHSLPVSTVQALIDQWRAEAARIDSFHATMGTGYHVCADQLAALLASQSLQTKEQAEVTPNKEKWCDFCERQFTGQGTLVMSANIAGLVACPDCSAQPDSASPSLHRQEQNEK